MSYVLYHEQITVRELAKIDLEDRGYNFGDGIYEVIPCYNGQTFSLIEHMQRFKESARKLEIPLPYSLTKLEMLLNELSAKNGLINGIIYVQMTRGSSPRSHLYDRTAKGVITGFCRELPFPTEQQHHGVSAFSTEDIRWLRCDIKTLNLLGNTMAKRQAADYNCHEALMHRGGTLTEGSSSNLFMIKNGIIYTHPATNLILNGITRQIVIKLATSNGFSVIEEPFTLLQLKEADEVFITSTSQEITPIVTIAGELTATYSIGETTRTLQRLFKQYVINSVLK